jgi:hypothetical protein
MVISYSNGIIHPYYTVALAPAVAAGIGLGAPLLWRRRGDIRAATAISATVLVTTMLSCVLLARTETWLGWLRPAIAVAGVGSAALLMAAGRLPDVIGRAGAAVAVVACLAGPTAYSVATAMTPHHGVIPSVGPAGASGHNVGNFLDPPDPSPALVAALRADAGRYTWTAATIGATNAAVYQLASGTPVMAVGGFNGTDPAPTLNMFQQLITNSSIHYFIDAPMGGSMHAKPDSSRQAANIVAWVQQHFPARAIDGVMVYTLFSPTG